MPESPPGAPRRLALERGASYFAVVALTVAQPLLDVVSSSPEFFVARNTTAARAVAAVLAICLGLPILLLALDRGIGRVSARAATAFHTLVLASLVSAFAMTWLRREGVTTGWLPELAAGAAAGLLAAALYRRWRAARLFLAVLAPAAVIVPATFFAQGDVRRAISPADAAIHRDAMARTPPVVFVVFDELPLNSLLNGRRDIDAGWYPNFAALARDAYWFRNAGTVSAETTWAVPALLSGRYPLTPHAVPTLRHYPDNLFTLLAGRYDIVAFLPFRQLCPSGACRGDASADEDTVPALLADLGVVWLHIVLPGRLADRLPPVTENWSGFAPAREGGAARGRTLRDRQFRRFVDAIQGRPGQLYFLHSLLPHWPLLYAPSGRRYRGPSYSSRREGGENLFLKASAEYADALHQRHLAQVAFVDRLLGDLMGRLRSLGVYDSTLLIVTADHGASYREGTSRRVLRPSNAWDIIHVPLFVKLPGQRGGRIVDRPVETVDILPTIVEVLSLQTRVPFDGRSLLDDHRARTVRTFIDRGRALVHRREFPDMSAASRVSLDRKLRRFGDGDPQHLYAPPDGLHLLGRHRSDLPLLEADVTAALDDSRAFDRVDLGSARLPLHAGGVLSGRRPPPIALAVLVNGRVAAVTRSFSREGEHVFGTLVPETLLRNGRNDVEVVPLNLGQASGASAR